MSKSHHALPHHRTPSHSHSHSHSLTHNLRTGTGRFFNYSKTPARGVRDFSVAVDGRVVFMGTLLPADK